MLPPVPIHFARWIEENEHLLQPPVNNYLLQRGDFIVMALGGPNARTDYHINQTEEWFCQHKGDMVLKIVTEEGEFQDIPVREGEMFLLPANIPHNPVRYANTIGIVIERNRRPEEIDRLRWYCEQCKAIVYEESFHCTDLGIQLKPIIERYASDATLRTCKACKHLNTAK